MNNRKKVTTFFSILSEIVEEMKPIRWTTPDVAIYISKYIDEHPEKKLTNHLRRKLEREYYRSRK